MPRLELSCARQQGNVQISAPDGLQAYGPTVEVGIWLHHATARKRHESGTPIPGVIVGNAMLDTGASVTTIDRGVAETLALEPSGMVESFGIGGKATGITVPCSVKLEGFRVNIPRCHCHDLSVHCRDLVCLIGRDILRHLVFHYDGPAGAIYLELQRPGGPGTPSAAPRGAKARKRKRRRK